MLLCTYTNRKRRIGLISVVRSAFVWWEFFKLETKMNGRFKGTQFSSLGFGITVDALNWLNRTIYKTSTNKTPKVGHYEMKTLAASAAILTAVRLALTPPNSSNTANKHKTASAFHRQTDKKAKVLNLNEIWPCYVNVWAENDATDGNMLVFMS